MGRILAVIVAAGLIAGCSSFVRTEPTDASRNVFGVTASRPDSAGTAAPEGEAADMLALKANQICTTGWEQVKQDIVPAEGGQQIVSRDLRCRPYQFSFFDADRTVLPNGIDMQ